MVSAPSGGGKTTVIRRLLERKTLPYAYSVSLTTRSQRRGEVDGSDYWFVTPEAFQRQVDAHQMVEYEEVHGHFYGTPRGPLDQWLTQGKVVLLDLDVYGALSVKKIFPDASCLIFIQPPDMDALRDRLRGRNTESDREVRIRLQRAQLEMDIASQFDYTVINKNLEKTVEEVEQIVKESVL